VEEAIRLRDRLLQEVLHPIAVDLLNPEAAAVIGRQGWLLAIGTQGNQAVLKRYDRELEGGERLEGAAETTFWDIIREITPNLLARNAEGVVVRCSVALQGLLEAMKRLPGAVLARAGNGVCYAHLDSLQQAADALRVGKAVMEYGPAGRDGTLEMWPDPGNAFPIMQRVKEMFDPKNLLNRGRLYGRI
jgi:glycolate oxidase FAD binding subunit